MLIETLFVTFVAEVSLYSREALNGAPCGGIGVIDPDFRQN